MGIKTYPPPKSNRLSPLKVKASCAKPRGASGGCARKATTRRPKTAQVPRRHAQGRRAWHASGWIVGLRNRAYPARPKLLIVLKVI